MDANHGMLFSLLTLLRQWLGLLPSKQQDAGLREKNGNLMPQPKPNRPAHQRRVYAFGELSPERSWFRRLAAGWPAPAPGIPCTPFVMRRALAACCALRR